MKKLLLIPMALMLIGSPLSYSQQGRNCFNTQFNNDATTIDMTNAYLLGYLCTMSYPQYLRFLLGNPAPLEKSSVVKSLQLHDDHFLDVYEEKLSPFFTPAGTTFIPRTLAQGIDKPAINVPVTNKTLTVTEPSVVFDFKHECNANGYDPEALLISTPTTIYVVFRGTDRVACNVSSLGYDWAEWMTSDFKFLKRDASMMHRDIKGQVHRGMVESLLSQNFADSLGSRINALLKNKVTGVNKKVWITGHSLGGGHAQLFAMFLKFNYNITAQGLYLYELPHPGDDAFVNQLNATIGKNRIQRFEFGDDPIPTLPPQVFFYARAGIRNFFKDYSSTIVKTEQVAGIDDLKILCALGNLPAEQIPQTAHFEFPPYCPGSTCFHHPTFILQAIRHQLNTSALTSLPAAVPLPLAGDNCIQGDLTKAENNDLVNNTATAIENTIVAIVWQASNMMDNLLGTGIEEGRYKLACYAFKNSPKRYLTWNGSTNSQLTISNTGSVFNLVHKLTGGYQLYISSGNMAADVTFNVLGLPSGEEKTNNIIMRPRDGIIGDEETWYFFKIPNKINTYALHNWNTHRMLDAENKCLSENKCKVNEFEAKSNEPTQVWILEKVN